MDIINEFYSRLYENKINQQMLYYNFNFPVNNIISYIDNISEQPIENFLEVIILCNNDISILPKDVFQFSNLYNATLRICSLLKTNGDPGVTYVKAGQLLLNDGKQRNKAALTKYGENHLKTAESLGLLQELTHMYFLSCLGFIINELSEEKINKLLVRLLLRNKFIIQLYRASQNGMVNMRQFLYMLSNSTYIRRSSNIKSVLKILSTSNEYDFSAFITNIEF